jgi:WD40 repeat protein
MSEGFMVQLLNYLVSTSLLMVMSWQAPLTDEARRQTTALPDGAIARLGNSRFLNFGRVFSVAYSPDGKLLAAGAWDGSFRVWDTVSGKELWRVQEQNGPVHAVDFAPDRKTLACSGKAATITIREVATGKEVRRLTGHRNMIRCVQYSPDGKLLASKANDQTMRLWDVASGSELRQFSTAELPKHVQDVDSPVSFSRDGKTITSATIPYQGSISSYIRTFRLWDVATGKEIRSFQDVSQWHGPVAFSPDGKLLATAGGVIRGSPPTIHLWDLERGRALPAIDISKPNRMTILASMTFSPDGKTLVSSDGGPIQIWELATRREARQFNTPDTGASCLAFSPSGRLLASGSTDTSALVWDATGRLQKGELPATKLSSEQCQTLWYDLAAQNPQKARQALWALIASGDDSTAFLRSQLHPVPSPTNPEVITQLINELSSAEFAVRSKASAQLVKLAEIAEPQLLEALNHQPALEQRRRIDEILKVILDLRSKPSGDTLRGWRAIEVLEQIGKPQARQLLEVLAGGAKGALLTQEAEAALVRLAHADAMK